MRIGIPFVPFVSVRVGGRRRRSCPRDYRTPGPYTVSDQRFRLFLLGCVSIFPGGLVLGGLTRAVTDSHDMDGLAFIATIIIAWLFFYRAVTLERPNCGVRRALYVLAVTCSTIIGPISLLIGIITAGLQLAGRADHATWHDTLTELTLGVIGTTIAGLALLRRARYEPTPEPPPVTPRRGPRPPPPDDGPLNPRMYYSNRR